MEFGNCLMICGEWFDEDIGFSTDIKTNLKEVDFADVTLNQQNGTYRPYK